MKRSRSALLARCVFSLAIAFGAAGNIAAALEPPQTQYLILHPNMVKMGKHGKRIYHPAEEVPAVAQGYAYGWFGAAPRSHWSRHHGYYKNYVRWSVR
jgi:hypothetical protein